MNIKVSYKLISTLQASKLPIRWHYHYCCVWSSMLKVLKVISLQYLYNISQKKLGSEFIFSLQMNIKVSYKLISTLRTSKLPIRWHYNYCCVWSSILKVLKVISLQYLYNISKKKLGREFIFLHGDEHQSFYKLRLFFLWKWQDMSKVPKIGSW